MLIERKRTGPLPGWLINCSTAELQQLSNALDRNLDDEGVPLLMSEMLLTINNAMTREGV